MTTRWLTRVAWMTMPGLVLACGGFSSTPSGDIRYATVSHLLVGGGFTSCANGPIGAVAAIAVDRAGIVYLADAADPYQRVDRLSADGKLVVFAGNGKNNGDTWQAAYEGRLATSVEVMAQGLTIDASGNVYIAGDYGRVFRVGTDGRIHWMAGRGQRQRFSGDGGPARLADFFSPRGLLTDSFGNLYISDYFNHRVRRVSPDGRITTVAGSGKQGHLGDGGLATSALLENPDGLALDSAGDVYIADSTGIRKITPDGMIATIAGNHGEANTGFEGQAVNASLEAVKGIALDNRGNVYIASSALQIDSALANHDGGLFVITTDGVLHRILQGTANGENMNAVVAVTSDPQGNIYYARECGIYRLGWN